MKDKEAIPLGTVVAGRYRVAERLGEGGMGSVYKVEHVHTGQELALKVLNPKMVEDHVALERFRRESRAPARIQSDHVVQVTDADVAPELGGVPFLVMELLRGESFDELLTNRKLTINESLGYLGQVARALDKAHGLGIVHRDIKPENLFLTRREDGTPCVKLLDFGIAKLTEGADVHSKTATGAIFGTPLYMAPEQILGQPDKISGRTDVWALGILAHKMLTGAEPWTAQTLPQLVAQIAYEPLPVPSALGSTHGPPFDEWFARCCARQPADRFATASEAITALAGALGADVVTSSPAWSTSSPKISGSTRDAFAATAAASSSAQALGSDTLAAQVAPKKSAGKVVLVAVLATALGIGGVVLWAMIRGNASTAEPAATTGSVTAEPTSVPATRPPSGPVVIEPLETAQADGSAAPPVTSKPAPSKLAGTTTGPKPPASAPPDKPPTSPKPKPEGDNWLDMGRK